MSIKEVKMNERDKRVLEKGDIGQGEHLVSAKHRNKKSNSQYSPGQK